MKKLLTILFLAGAVWGYFWFVRGENILLRGAEVPAAPPYIFTDRLKPNAQPKWESAAPMPTLRTGAGAAAIGSKVYVMGGYDSLAKSLDTAEVFDVRANLWEKIAPIPKPVHFPAVVSDGDKIYVMGGLTGLANTPSDLMWIFDPSKGDWSAGPDLPDPIGAAAAVFYDGGIHLMGGVGLGRSTQAHQVYVISEGRWHSEDALVSGRDHFAAAVLAGRIWVAGGRGGSLLYNMDDFEIFEPKSHSWEQRAQLPVKRSAHGLAVLGGQILFFGGESSSAAYGDMYVYEPKSDQWRIGVPMPTPRFGFGYAVAEGRIVTIGGGRRQGFSVSDVVEIYTPAP